MDHQIDKIKYRIKFLRNEQKRKEMLKRGPQDPNKNMRV